MAPTGRIRAPSQNTPKAFSSAAVSFLRGEERLGDRAGHRSRTGRNRIVREKLPLVARRMAPMRDLICGRFAMATFATWGNSLPPFLRKRLVREKASRQPALDMMGNLPRPLPLRPNRKSPDNPDILAGSSSMTREKLVTGFPIGIRLEQ